MPGSERDNRCILLDWGDTLMRDFSDFDGPMYTWPRVEAMPHAVETLAALHPAWTLAIATNAAASDEAEIRKALDRVDLERWIDRVYCFQKIGHQKPSPAFFETILADLALAPERVVMVGDNFEVDVLGANRSGIRAIWLNTRSDDVRSGDLYRTIGSITALHGALEAMLPDFGYN